jgi:hypothetical protein
MTIAEFDDFFEAQESFLSQAWSDGLPCVPPTPELVARMVDAGGRPADALLGTLASRQISMTVEQAAVCAVMAGCKPAYFPVVLATWDALFDPRVNLHSALTSSGGSALMGIVSGPYAGEIGMNGTTGAFAPGNRANATIGRAIRLGALTVFRAIPQELDMSAFGHGGKYSFHYAERQPPAGWPSLREQLGFDVDATTVTVMACDGPRQIAHRWNPTPEGFLRTLASTMKDPSQNATGCGSCYVVALGPEHAGLLAEAGLQPRDIRAALSEFSTTSEAELLAAGIELRFAPNHYSEPDARGRLLTARPEHILVVTAGGFGSGWSAVIPCFTTLVTHHPATRPVRLPGRTEPRHDPAVAEFDFA